MIERFEMMCDSGGAGRTRGGVSLRKDVRILADGTELSNLTDRQRFAPYGLDGGEPGRLGETLLNPGRPEERRLESKGAYVFRQGDLVSFRCSGSGGFGPPSERDPELVRRDVAEGFVSPHAARQIYGVDDA
jgi:N-methylhydantoinase B